MCVDHFWLDNLTLVALLTINSFPFPFPYKISGGLNVFANLIVISHFVFILDPWKSPGGNLFVINNNESSSLYTQNIEYVCVFDNSKFTQ